MVVKKAKQSHKKTKNMIKRAIDHHENPTKTKSKKVRKSFVDRVKGLIRGSKKQKSMKIIIVGGGETALALSVMLEQEHHVTIVEIDPAVAKELATRTNLLIIQGDGVDQNVLIDAGIQSADALISATADDRTNLMVCQISKNEGVPKIISFVNSPRNEELFTKSKIARIVSKVGSTVTTAKRFLYQIGEERVVHLIGSGQAQIIEMRIRPKSKLVGKKAEIKNAVVAAIIRESDNKVLVPPGETLIKSNDLVVIIAKKEDLPKIVGLS